MPKFYVVHGSVQVATGKTAEVGTEVELTDAQAAAPLAAGIIVPEAKYLGLKKQAEGVLEAGGELAGQPKAVRNLAALAKDAPKPAKPESKEPAKQPAK